jgi:hypothetical protein
MPEFAGMTVTTGDVAVLVGVGRVVAVLVGVGRVVAVGVRRDSDTDGVACRAQPINKHSRRTKRKVFISRVPSVIISS